MLRLVLAFVCLVAVGHAADSLELWRKDLRSPENQAIIRQLQEQQNAAKPCNQMGPPSTQVDVTASNEIARHILHFAQSLGNQLATNYSKTEVFSPLSIVSSLALLFLGATGRSHQELSVVFGTTDSVKFHEQFGLMLRDVQQPTIQTISPQRQLVAWREETNRPDDLIPFRLSANDNTNKPHEVYLANGLFSQIDYTVNADYRQVITQIYKTQVLSVDFEKTPVIARNRINNWVEEHTKDKIKEIIPNDLPQGTRMILANALYFKGFWETEFGKGTTRPDNFYPNGLGSQPAIRVQMMATGGNFPYHEDLELGCRIIGLPYKGNLSTMYIIQPLKSSVDELKNLRQRFNADLIEDMIGKMSLCTALVALPKMHIVESVNLQTVMQRMGLGGIYSPGDLSLIGSSPASTPPSTSASCHNSNSLQNLEAQRQAAAAGSRSDLLVEDIVHKVDFNVNEQGTEAAAATATILNKSGPNVLFRCDTPFLMLLRHDPTKLILFYGWVNEPPTAN